MSNTKESNGTVEKPNVVPVVPVVVEGVPTEKANVPVATPVSDKVKAEAFAQQEFMSKYPGKKPSTFAQRKISNKGGVQYFDSGDYYMNKNSKEEKKEIASHPALMAVRAPKKKSVGQGPSKLC